MTVSKTTLLALLKASRPTFKAKAERLAFVVHAFLLARGFRAVAVGSRADSADPDEVLTEEVDTDGWNDMGDHFAFRYLPETGNVQEGLQVMMDGMGDSLLLHWATISSKSAPETLSLRLSEYTTEADGLQEGYNKLDQLVDVLNGSSLGDVPVSSAKQPAQSRVAAKQEGSSARTPGRRLHEEEEPDMDDPLQPGGVQPPWGSAVLGQPPAGGGGVGSGDLVPPGLRAPGASGGFGVPHLDGPGMGGGMRGGMHVGPGDPLFDSRLRQGGPRGPGGPPSGARFDPINPQGLPGWNPDDFQQQGRRGPAHPDVMQPGPGRGSNFDSMFG